MNGDRAAPASRLDGGSSVSEDQIERAVATLRQGGVVALPTDTVYGYAASLLHPAAIARIYTIKGRPEAKAIPILLSSAQAIGEVATRVDPATLSFAERWWPGALTLIVDARPELPGETITRDAAGRNTAAVRVPASSVALRIISGAGGALAVTSANRSGEEPAHSARGILRTGASSPDLIVDCGECPLGLPSSIISVTSSSLKVIREGAIPVAELANFAKVLGLAVETLTPHTV